MKKKGKKLLLGLLATCMCVSLGGFAACKDSDSSTSTDTSSESSAVTIELNQTSCRVEIGKTVTLTATASDGSTVTWESKDTSIATVANGVVTGVAAGSTKIVAKAGGTEKECTVEVVDLSDLVFTLEEEAATVVGGMDYEIPYTATQSGKAQNVTVTATSDNEAAATAAVKDGKIVITGVKKGTATVTAKTTFLEKEYKKTIAVTVNNDVELTIVRSDPEASEREMNLSMLADDEFPTQEQLGVSLYANGDTNDKPTVTWTPADNTIVTAENGLIKAVGIGTTRVTVTYEGEPEGASTYIDVTVSPMKIDKSETDFMVFQKTSKANGRDTMTFEKLKTFGVEGNVVSMRWDAAIIAEGGTDAIQLKPNSKNTGLQYECADMKDIPYGRQTAYILTDAHKEYKVTIYMTGTRIINVSGFKKWQKGGFEEDADFAKYVVLDGDVDFKGEDYSVSVNEYWANMTAAKVAFNFGGTFDGRGHTIKNGSVRYAQSALICNTLQAGGVIRNVVFENIEVKANDSSMTALGGVVSGVAKNATIENVFIRGSLGDSNLSGLLTYYCQGTIKNCVAILENSPAANPDRPARGILGVSILPQPAAFDNCVAIGALPGVACWRERAGGGTEIRPHKFGNVEINEDGADVTQYMTNCYNAATAQKFANLDLTKFGDYWDKTGTVPVMGNVDIEVSAPTTILMRESDGIRIQSSAHVGFALKQAVKGVTLNGNLLTVDNTATQDATVVVVATSTLNEKFTTELTFTVDIMTHKRPSGDFAYFDKTKKNDVTIDISKVLAEGETVTAVKSLGAAEIISTDKIVNGIATFAYADWSKELNATGDTEILLYTDKGVAYHLTVVVADYVIGTVDEYKAWHTTSRGEYVKDKKVGGYVVLTGDIDFANADGEKQVYCVSYVENSGAGQFMFRFEGTFDGRGHTISNAIVDKTQSGIIAGSLEPGGLIKNVSMKGIVLTGGADTNGKLGWEGGIVDFLAGGVIENCYVEGEIKDDAEAIGRTIDGRGLICSRVTSGKVKNCVAVLTNTIANVANPTAEGEKTPANVMRGVLGNMLAVPANNDAFTNCIAIGSLYGVCSQANGGAIDGFNGPNGFKTPNADMSSVFENINSYKTVAEYKEAAADVNAQGFLKGSFWDFAGDVPQLKPNQAK